MNPNLADLFQKKRKQAAGFSVDWDDRRNKYVKAVENLYDQIDTMLAEPIEQKTVTIQRRQKQLTENHIGTYAVPDLILLIGDEQVRFSPRGGNIVGAAGRIDVIGERAEAMMILNRDAEWGFVQSRQPKVNIAPFDESTFAEVLKLVMRA